MIMRRGKSYSSCSGRSTLPIQNCHQGNYQKIEPVCIFRRYGECEDDDQMSKTLTTSAVSESPSMAHLDLEITNTLISSSPLRVSYSIPANQPGTISVYDPSGRCAHTRSVTGTGKLDFDTKLPAGVYIVKLESEGDAVSRKAIILR